MANTEQKYNLKLSVVAGLQNDYNVFNLRRGGASDTDDAYNNIKVMIFTDGLQYVENDATQMMHAGESSYKEFDGVLPVVADEGGGIQWEVDNYGPKLKQKLKQYISMSTNVGQDIYDTDGAYKYYKNQFKVFFKENGSLYGADEPYVTYKEITDTLKDKQYIDKSLDALSGSAVDKYVYLNANIVHFSKYYNVYSASSIPVPQLLPLIHDLDSLGNYGLGLDSQGLPYVSTLWGHKHWAGKTGRYETVYFRNHLYNYDAYVNGYATRNSDNDNNWFADLGFLYDHEDDHDISMFKSNYWGADGMVSRNEEDWIKLFPKGFALFGIENESRITTTLLSKNGRGTSERNSYYKSDYTKIFACGTNLYDFEHKYIAGNDRSVCMVALAYYADSDGNPHIFNTWFPVKMRGTTVTLEINYQSGMGTDKPKYVGNFVASILANIYTYLDDVPGVVGYVSDIVYLSPNKTSFIKDVVFKARVTLVQQSSYTLTEASNKLLLINKVNYNDYVNSILTKALPSVDEQSKIDFTNVNAVIKGCVKNIPLQLDVNYKEPNIDAVNLKNSQVIIKKIDGSTETILKSSILEKDKLYLITVDDLGESTVEYLKASFTIHFIGKITDDGSNLKAEYLDIPSIKSDLVHKIFKVESGMMIPATSRVMGAYGKYYSIGTYYSGHQDNAVKDLIKDEVLIPYARVL